MRGVQGSLTAPFETVISCFWKGFYLQTSQLEELSSLDIAGLFLILRKAQSRVSGPGNWEVTSFIPAQTSDNWAEVKSRLRVTELPSCPQGVCA